MQLIRTQTKLHTNSICELCSNFPSNTTFLSLDLCNKVEDKLKDLTFLGRAFLIKFDVREIKFKKS